MRSKLTLAINKPRGFVSNLPNKGERAASELITFNNAFKQLMKSIKNDDLKRVTKDAKSFNVCGRLDKDSRGLLILTEDGALARGIIGRNEVIKRYEVTIDCDVKE